MFTSLIATIEASTGVRDADFLLRHAGELLTMTGALPTHDVRGTWDPSSLGIVRDGAVASHRGVIVAVGTSTEVERAITLLPGATVFDAHRCLVTPGLVDAHTHALFAGDRAHEFSMRLQGASYADIAAAGGGIASTVRAVRQCTDAVLGANLDARLTRMRSRGVTTVEVKTGYALDIEHELRCLALLGVRGDRVVPTFLPLHAVPPEFKTLPDGRARYLTLVLDEMLPRVAAQGIARFIDAYIDSVGFSVDEARPILSRARALGLRPRLHIGQFDDVGGAEFAAEVGAASADHLESVSDAGLTTMAAAGVAGVLLPCAAFSLGQTMPDARRMRAHGLALAVATDCNPGTSYAENLLFAAALAVRQMGLSSVEAWWAVTRIPALSLGRSEVGAVAPGLLSDLAVFEDATWETLAYRLGDLRASATFTARELFPSESPSLP